MYKLSQLNGFGKFEIVLKNVSLDYIEKFLRNSYLDNLLIEHD